MAQETDRDKVERPVLDAGGSKPTGHKDIRHVGAEPEPEPGLAAAKALEAGAIPLPEDGKELKLEPEQEKLVVDASEWLLESFDGTREVTQTLELNIGTSAKPKRILWTIKSVDGQLLREIRARSAERAEQSGGRRTNVAAVAREAYEGSLEIVVAGTVEPDLRGLAEARGLADTKMVLEGAFQNKAGLVEALAGEIMALSGYDNEDVRDHLETGVATFS